MLLIARKNQEIEHCPLLPKKPGKSSTNVKLKLGFRKLSIVAEMIKIVETCLDVSKPLERPHRSRRKEQTD